MQKEDYLQVGVITTTHGIRGEVKVFPTTDDPARFEELENVMLDTGRALLPLEIQNVKYNDDPFVGWTDLRGECNEI